MTTLRVLGVHGLGDQRGKPWPAAWKAAVERGLGADSGLIVDFHDCSYDDVFERHEPSLGDTLEAVARLIGSGLGAVFRPRKGFMDPVSHRLRWTAGYVVAWTADQDFQRETRARFLERVKAVRPHVILAHSLGSLITYNALTHRDATGDVELGEILRQCRYVTLGSQLRNDFVVGNLTNGRLMPLDVRWWHHLYNRHDKVFTAPIVLQSARNFGQIDTTFDEDDDHAAERYIEHTATAAGLWRPLEAEFTGARGFGFAPVEAPPPEHSKANPAPRRRKRALLVGINDYPDPSQRLEGCVNDVFLMSSVLQQSGFEAGDIRTCLDSRATAEGVISRLGWLLDDARDGDELVFYYSGHGARVPEYGAEGEPDHHTEVLVTHDFDWTPERWVSDDRIQLLYSQLPSDCRFAMILDCCHSGGLHRDGGMKARGIAPPDDIRHRELKWHPRREMWVERTFREINPDFAPKSEAETAARFFGSGGATYRLGRAGMLRPLSSRRYAELKRENPEMARGAYLPLIIEACSEEEFSYEYRHGATSYGAFTFSLASILRRKAGKGGTPSFQEVVEAAALQLKELGYAQTPAILGPRQVVEAPVPFMAA